MQERQPIHPSNRTAVESIINRRPNRKPLDGIQEEIGREKGRFCLQFLYFVRAMSYRKLYSFGHITGGIRSFLVQGYSNNEE